VRETAIALAHRLRADDTLPERLRNRLLAPDWPELHRLYRQPDRVWDLLTWCQARGKVRLAWSYYSQLDRP
jgi:hypothetical protein